MKKIKWLSVTLVLLIVLTSLTGCAMTPSTVKSTPETAGALKTTDASKTKEFVLYSSFGIDKEVIQAFEAKKGIKVNLVHNNAGSLLAKVQAERNNPQWDLFWIEGAGSFQTLDQLGLLLTGWEPQNASNYTDLGKSLVPSDKAYTPTGTTAAGIIAYNTKLLTPDQAPKDWSDLLKPEYKDAFAMPDPNISGPTYPLIAEIINKMGIEKGQAFFMDWKKNGLKIFPDGGTAIKELVAGNVKVSLMQDIAAIDAKAKGSPVEVVYPTSGVTMLSSLVGIQKHAANLDAAKQFIEFVLTPEAQNIILESNTNAQAYFQPVIKGINPKASGRPQDGVKWNPLDTAWASQHETELKNWFHINIVQ